MLNAEVTAANQLQSGQGTNAGSEHNAQLVPDTLRISNVSASGDLVGRWFVPSPIGFGFRPEDRFPEQRRLPGATDLEWARPMEPARASIGVGRVRAGRGNPSRSVRDRRT